MIKEDVVFIDRWLLINKDNKSNWKYLFLVDGKIHTLSEAEDLYNEYHNQPERLNPEGKNWFGMRGIVNDGICYFEDGTSYDFTKPIDVCDSPNCDNK